MARGAGGARGARVGTLEVGDTDYAKHFSIQKLSVTADSLTDFIHRLFAGKVHAVHITSALS